MENVAEPAKLLELIQKSKKEAEKYKAELPQAFSALVEAITSSIENAKRKDNSDAYRSLTGFLRDAKAEMRECIQELTRESMLEIIQKLESGQGLGAEDIDLVRLWIVGDADSYLRAENNYKDWIRELDRIEGDISAVKNQQIETKNFSRLQALLTDMDRTAQNVFMYLSERERVARFEQATKQLDSRAGAVMAELLNKYLEKPES
ncbi:MAG: hypothetical protein A3G41_07825 [Elusimicrobia bacterium RIFCSPLOWO2_12_FULL_59_9]|nr:MAG: hypothetical protein A3G41_07825 [Elusimicrobia bacterium RIFCSPLOWO2_12_FULL_59_9]